MLRAAELLFERSRLARCLLLRSRRRKQKLMPPTIPRATNDLTAASLRGDLGYGQRLRGSFGFNDDWEVDFDSKRLFAQANSRGTTNFLPARPVKGQEMIGKFVCPLLRVKLLSAPFFARIHNAYCSSHANCSVL